MSGTVMVNVMLECKLSSNVKTLVGDDIAVNKFVKDEIQRIMDGTETSEEWAVGLLNITIKDQKTK